jgi:hypothetical protein
MGIGWCVGSCEGVVLDQENGHLDQFDLAFLDFDWIGLSAL